MPPVLRALRTAGAAHIRTAELQQGITSRWVVAWSFVPEAAPLLVAPSKPANRAFEAPAGMGPSEATRRTLECLNALGGEEWEPAAAASDDVAGYDVGDTSSSKDLSEGRAQAFQGQARSVIARRRFQQQAAAIGSAEGGSSKRKRPRAPELVPSLAPVPAEGSHPAEAPEASPSSTPLSSAPSQPSSSSSSGEFVVEVVLDSREEQRLQLEVVLIATPRGEASSAFWRVADQIRNDVVRDTRKWRRSASAARQDQVQPPPGPP